METVLKAIADWIKGILTAGIMSNLSGLFDDVNTQVGNIAQQVGTKPSSFEPRVFAMIEALSRNVVLPIAGIILTFIACYELIEMITQHNNMAQFEPALIMRWIFKTAVSVWLISNTFDIVMAVFDLTQKVVSDSSGIIAGNTRVNDIGLSMLEASLMQMDVGPLFGLFLQSFFIGILNAELKEGQTSPPKHFTEDTLLHAMETASADSMPEGVERQGIGTPATRAATIEKLVQKGFLERKGSKKTKVLLPTDKGKALITVMPEEIQSPEMTADWETKLLQIERSEMEPSEFMTEIKEMISSLVTTTEAAKGANALMKNKIIGVCPNCGKPVVEREKGWFCENRECRFVLWKDNAFFKRLGKRLDAHVADKLLRDGRVRLKDCKSAKGKTYNATVLLGTEPDGRSKFSLEFEGGC